MGNKTIGIEKIKGGITCSRGFHATGNHIGIKEVKKDLAIIYSEVPAKACGVFTTNMVKAASILWDQNLIRKKKLIQAIIINSGNANACTGEIGKIHNEVMAKKLASCLNLDINQVLTASTGIIGVPLPIDVIIEGIEKTYKNIGTTAIDAHLAAEAIMTTDTNPKEISFEFSIADTKVRIGGMAKGSGMIHPNMATMLSFITTDVNISRELLKKALNESINKSYNMISVDGDMSTNDSVIVLANGLSKNPEIRNEDRNYRIFKHALHQVNLYLAKEIIRDGEGASKVITVNVKGANSDKDAKILSKSIINSNLVKTAFFGEDANWGRIIAAMGYSGVVFDLSKVSIRFKNGSYTVLLIEKGIPLKFDENIAKEILKETEITVEVLLNDGNGKATAWGCDLSYDYIRINGQYRT